MNLVNEIKQNVFKSEYHKLLVNIMYTHGWIHSKIAARLKPYGITPQQYNILRILRGQYPNSARIKLLEQRMLDRMSNASRLVERLRQKGLVERSICKKDRRAVDVIITEDGLNLLKILDESEQKWINEFKNIGLDNAKHTNKILDALRG
ncbi:MAG: MarR family transcriptional regulator [Calditrichaceae bacterium]|nr:MarR family transcriptional regulator [Calditrichaceae bacterium]